MIAAQTAHFNRGPRGGSPAAHLDGTTAPKRTAAVSSEIAPIAANPRPTARRTGDVTTQLVAEIGARQTVDEKVDAVVAVEDRLGDRDPVASSFPLGRVLERRDGVARVLDVVDAPGDEVGHVEDDERAGDDEKDGGELETQSALLGDNALQMDAELSGATQTATDEEVEKEHDDERYDGDEDAVDAVEHEVDVMMLLESVTYLHPIHTVLYVRPNLLCILLFDFDARKVGLYRVAH